MEKALLVLHVLLSQLCQLWTHRLSGHGERFGAHFGGIG